MRFFFAYSLKRLPREGLRSLSVPLIAFTLVVLINALGGIRDWLEMQYEDIMDNFPIRAELSDLLGENTDELYIDMRNIGLFTNPDAPMSLYSYTSNLVLSRSFETVLEDTDMDVNLIGTTSLDIDEYFTLEDDVIVTFFDGYDESALLSNEPVAIVSEDLLSLVHDGRLNLTMQEHLEDEWIFPAYIVQIHMGTINGEHWEVFVHEDDLSDDGWGGLAWDVEDEIDPGDIPYILVEGEVLTTDISLSVIGTISGAGSDTVYSPFWFVSEIAEEFTGLPPYSQRLSMTVADNRELHHLKGVASMTYSHVRPIGSTREFAMVVYSLEFYETLEPLRQNAILVDVALPIVYIISIAVGFLTSMLLTRQRKAEFAVMRSIGINRGDIFVGALGEQFVLCLIGAVLGLSLIAVFWGYLSFLHPAVFLACYTLGAAFSAARAAKSNVLAILRDRE